MKIKYNNLKSAFLILAAIFFMSEITEAQPNVGKAAPSNINYTVGMSKPYTHLLEVEMRVAAPVSNKRIELKMPVWTPGSYLIREYARHVQDFDAQDITGKTLAWRKVNKNTWQIDKGTANEIVVKYKVYANELTVRTNELNADHAFWNNAATLMFPKDRLKEPSTVKVVPFQGWKIATGLPPEIGQTDTFRAANYDILYDSPFEVSNFKQVDFTVEGKPHRFVFSGDGNYNLPKTAADTAKIIEEAYKLFGELPYDNYTFIVNLRGGGGLEHLNSTALQWNKYGFTGSRYTGFLGLVAHEYFHLWNVKRIRPDALGPFDYENENYTRLLWVAEGGTAYYEGILPLRAGIISAEDFLKGKASAIQQLQNRPGRFETSLEDASFDAWIKYYRQDENSINNQISYYDKGELVNFLLDTKIRTESKGTKSLDDVMRYLYNNFYKKNKNYAPADFQKTAEMMAGTSLDDFFAKYVRGTEEIDYNSILAGIGLQLKNDADKTRQQAYLGANLSETDGLLTVRSLPAGTPAYDAGLNTGDQIVAIDGTRASQNFLQSYLNTKKSGDKIKLTVFRFDELRELTVTLGTQPPQNYEIVPLENPTAEQKRLYQDYLGAGLE